MEKKLSDSVEYKKDAVEDSTEKPRPLIIFGKKDKKTIKEYKRKGEAAAKLKK